MISTNGSADVQIFLNPPQTEHNLPQIGVIFTRFGITVRAYFKGEPFEFGGLDWSDIDSATRLTRRGTEK